MLEEEEEEVEEEGVGARLRSMRDPSRGVIADDRVPCSQPEPLDSATSTSDKEGSSKNSVVAARPIVVLAIKTRRYGRKL